MKKIIYILLCVAMCLCLFGCSTNSDSSPATTEAVTEKAETTNNASIVFFKTDNDADCALISYKNTNILIDTGEKGDGKDVAKYLEKNGITAIDCVIFSHFDKDHCGGALKLIEKVEIKEIIHPEYIKKSDETKKLFELVSQYQIADTSIAEDEEIEFDGIKIKLYPPQMNSYIEKESNNSSMVAMVEILGKKSLFTGDCEKARVEELIDYDIDFKADIFKLMYHGREVANESEFISKVTPSYTIITGDSDSKKVRENIDALSSSLGEYYYTCDGTVAFEITENSIQVSII